jgi:hypothetical protein
MFYENCDTKALIESVKKLLVNRGFENKNSQQMLNDEETIQIFIRRHQSN